MLPAADSLTPLISMPNSFISVDPLEGIPPMDRATRSAIRRVQDDLRRMEQVRRAPRCNHIKSDGVRCGSPALTNGSYCYAHTQMHRPSPGLDSLPPFEDANGIQCALMQVADAIVRGEIDIKRAALLLYALQIASANLKRVRFEPAPHHVVRQMIEEAENAAGGGRATPSNSIPSKKNPPSSAQIRGGLNPSESSVSSVVKEVSLGSRGVA